MCCLLGFYATYLRADKVCKIQQPKAKLDQCILEMHSKLLMKGVINRGKKEAALSLLSLQPLSILLYVRWSCPASSYGFKGELMARADDQKN